MKLVSLSVILIASSEFISTSETCCGSYNIVSSTFRATGIRARHGKNNGSSSKHWQRINEESETKISKEHCLQ